MRIDMRQWISIQAKNLQTGQVIEDAAVQLIDPVRTEIEFDQLCQTLKMSRGEIFNVIIR